MLFLRSLSGLHGAGAGRPRDLSSAEMCSLQLPALLQPASAFGEQTRRLISARLVSSRLDSAARSFRSSRGLTRDSRGRRCPSRPRGWASRTAHARTHDRMHRSNLHYNTSHHITRLGFKHRSGSRKQEANRISNIHIIINQ